MSEIVFDVESYRNVFLVGLKRLSDGKTIIMEESDRETIDRDRLRGILMQNTMIGFNSMSYDAPVIWAFVDGADPETIKVYSDRIIQGRLKYWEVENALGISIPWDFRQNHIDLIEPQPNPVASLKTLHARMHGAELRDLPYAPDAVLSHSEIDMLRVYLERSDLPATEKLWNALREDMDLRRHVGEMIGKDVRSKSDTQMGLAIIQSRIEQQSGQRIPRGYQDRSFETFRYTPPPYICFDDPGMRARLQRIRDHEFKINANGKVDFPGFLDLPFDFHGGQYSMGIGGLHSTEANRAIHSDDHAVLTDWDVASYYPAIILTLGLFPKALGPAFLKVYESIRADRLAAKKAKNKAVDKALKIALNGTFGSLGSPFSFAYSPELLIAVTITGQLALLQLIERAAQAGIPTVSANTDGVVFKCPRSLFAGIKDTRPHPSPLADVVEGWERETGFTLEGTVYEAIYNQSVNSYIAIKEGGGHKRKGPSSNPWSADPNDADKRASLMKNPQATIVSDAVLAKIKHGTPLIDTIRACTDFRQFVTVIKVTAGATWRGRYLGKVVRYYYGRGGDEIIEAKPNKTGTYKKVPKTDGAIECMTLPETLPDDIDYSRYLADAEEMLKDFGYHGDRAFAVDKRIRLTKANRIEVLSTWMVAP